VDRSYNFFERDRRGFSQILLRQKFQNKRNYKKGPKDLGQIKKQKKSVVRKEEETTG